MTGGYADILSNRRNGALSTGVCAGIAVRIMQHREGTGSKFCKKYGIGRLVYVERHDRIDDAIAREKAIKKWRRSWKIDLIERDNPNWRDRFYDINR